MCKELSSNILMDDLDDETDKWVMVVNRRNDSLSYSVKSCKPKNGGPLKYLSTTTFNRCSRETLRDFYMDNFYKKEWDKTLIEHQKLQLDETNGTEIRRTIKKFPLLTPREDVLAWRIWEGRDGTYYCYSKECDHPLDPTRNKYVCVALFRSGWRIREGRHEQSGFMLLVQSPPGWLFGGKVQGSLVRWAGTGMGATLNVAKPKQGMSVAIFGLGVLGLAAYFESIDNKEAEAITSKSTNLRLAAAGVIP